MNDDFTPLADAWQAQHGDGAEGAARRSVPVPEAVIADLRRLRAEADARFARLAGGDPAPDAPLVLVYDEVHALFHLPVDAAARERAAAILAEGAGVNLRPVTAAPSAPDAGPVLGRVRAAADAFRIRVECEHAEAEARRRAQAKAERARETAATVTAAELAWANLFQPDGDGAALAWQGYPSTLNEFGGRGALAAAHLGEGVFVLYEPARRGGVLSLLAPCACGPGRFRTDTVRSAATLSRLLDDILGQAPECAGTCAVPW